MMIETPVWVVAALFIVSFVQFWRNCSYLQSQWEDRRIHVYWLRQDQELARWEANRS